MQNNKKKQYLKRLYLNLGFMLVAVLLVYFTASASIQLLKNNISNKAHQEQTADILTKVDQYEQAIKKGDYQKARQLLESVENSNEDDRYDRYISEMTRKLVDDYNLVCQSLYGETVNDNIASRVKGLKIFGDQITGLLEESIDNHYNSFISLQSDYQPTINFLKNAMLFELYEDKLSTYIATVEELNGTRQDYQRGVNFMERGEYADAILYLQSVPESDVQFYTDAQKRIEECNDAIVKDYLENAQTFMDKGRYQDALILLNNAKNYYPDNTELQQKINYCESRLSEMNIYEGTIYHLFFNSLIVYPELAFDGDYKSDGYNKDMVTKEEFKKVLNQLYQRNFVLVDVQDLFETYQDGDQTFVRKRTLYLPKGKKPLILSIGDVSYYENWKGDGFANRLILDDQGKVATVTMTPEGSESITYDGDIMPIVDTFVEEHPDFSYLGAKGIIAVTGYEGILGYRTNLIDAPNYETVRAEAKGVADALKSSGWKFANHSYSHNEDFADGIFDLAILQYDVERWKREVESITGSTNIYITPFGYQVNTATDKYDYLTSQGYEVISGIGENPYHVITDKALIIHRQTVNGFNMYENPGMFSSLFDVASVIDTTRPLYSE